MKYKIVFDTNTLFIYPGNDPLVDLFSSNMLDSVGFIKKHALSDKIILSIPEVVIEEKKQQIVRQAMDNIEKIVSGFKVLSQLNDHFDLSKIQDECDLEYSKIIREKLLQKLNSDNVEIIKLSAINPEELMDRAIRGIKPFNNNKKDNGCKRDDGIKDTLIWLSLLEDAKNNYNSCEYIFCTNNTTQFNKEVIEEFKKAFNKELIIIKGIDELKEFLDEKFELKLGIKKIYDEIKENISKNAGDLILQFNEMYFKKTGYNQHLRQMISDSFDYLRIWQNQSDESAKELVAMNYRSLNFESITEGIQDHFEVIINLVLKPIYKQENEKNQAIESSWASSRFTTLSSQGFNDYILNKDKTFRISIDYDFMNKQFKISDFY